MAFKDVLTTQTPTTGSGFGKKLGGELGGKIGGGFGSVLGQSTSTADLKTSQGLYNLAVQSGLEEQANRVLAEKGEETKKIFSGGFITDIFDTLNAIQYGVVGVLKGKSFREGMETRQSWSDKDALGEFGIPGMIGGIALDIACDPLTYIAPWTIAKKIPGVTKGAKAATKTFKTSKVGKFLGSKFVYRFGEDPVYKLLDERRIKNIATAQKNIQKLIEPIVLLPKGAKLLTRTKTGSFIRTPLSVLKKTLTKDELWNVTKAYSILDDMGKEAVEAGLLKKGVWEANLGEYIKNAYTKFEVPKTKKGLFDWAKRGIKGIKKRKPLTLAKRAELGEIENPAYLLSKSIMDLNVDIENAKLFGSVAKKLSSNVAKEGLEQLPKTARLGKLAGQYVDKPIFDSLQEIVRSRTAWDKATGKLVAGFKFGKVIMNPATHARNIISNKLLNWWKLGLGPWRVDIDIETASQFIKKGKYWKELDELGYLDDATYVAQELGDLLGRTDAINAFGKGKNIFQKAGKKLGDLYQGEEKFAKMAAYIFKRKAGMGVDDAWKVAMSATFDYSQVTPFIRKLRTSLFGFPFITFTTKATPVAIETALKAPHRISALGKIKTAIENQSDIKTTARERASEPAWIRDGFYIKLPIKDKQGRSAYFDLTYIIPFGDLVSGDFIERQISRETGVKEGLVQGALRKSPFFNFVKEISSNQDFYGNRIWKDGDSEEKQLGDLFRHLVKTYSPPLISDQIPGGYITKGQYQGQRRPTTLARTKTAEGTQQRNLMEEMLRNVGLKIQPIDVDIQETYMEWEKKKALQTLLNESGVLEEFQTYYQPRQ